LPICLKLFTTPPNSLRVSKFTLKDLGYEFPKYPVPPGETMTSFLRQRTEEGARRRYTGQLGKPSFEKAHRQINHELRLIEKLKLEGYFLNRLGHR